MRVRKIHLSLCEPKALSSHTKTFSSSQNKDSKIAYLLFFLAFFKLSFACWFLFVCLFWCFFFPILSSSKITNCAKGTTLRGHKVEEPESCTEEMETTRTNDK